VIDAALAARIRLVGLDVDGTLTEGGLYIGVSDGRPVELKRYDIKDGMGIVLLRMAGVPVVLASGRSSESSRLRAEELKVDYVHDAVGKKLPLFETVMRRHGIGWDAVAFVGDDLPDLPLLRRAALPVAVADAVAEAKALAAHTTAARGGQGAVREFAEDLLRARGQWDDVLRTYLRERGDGDA
jgi:3-deoxy-D-manno-octulosonate 8-phosphate phosphatase (KDO 8-P phosphatase)